MRHERQNKYFLQGLNYGLIEAIFNHNDVVYKLGMIPTPYVGLYASVWTGYEPVKLQNSLRA